MNNRNLLGASVAVIAVALSAQAASAASTQPTATASAPEGGAAQVEEVVITGSRVSRVGFVAPTPVTALSSDQLKQASAGNITEALRQLPILSASTGARGATGSAGNGGTFLNLRRLGGPRTLTLLDGRRFVPTNAQGTIDSSLFPQALISRVEIVTGGASAAYGSDAVAGVVNFILDKEFQGVKGEIMGGVSAENDMSEQKYSLTAGSSFGGGRGHFLISGEYFDNNGVYDLLQRKNYRRGCLVINTPAGSATGRTFACDVRASNANFGGVITAGALRGTTFDSNSNAIPFNFGSLTTNATQVGGDGPLTQFLPLAVPIKRATLFSRVSWDLADNVTAYVEANYGSAEYEYQVGSFSQTIGATALTIFRDNAYLPADVRARMVTANLNTFALGRYSRDLPRTWISNLNSTTRVVGGFDADWRGIKWNGYYEHGENRRAIDAQYALNLDKYQEASDAVVGPGGRIVCRSTLTNPGNGCIPINVLGEHPATPEQIAYVTGTSWTTQKTTEDVIALGGDATVFQLPAGPVSLAAGVEYRRQELTSTADPLSTVFSVKSNAQGPYRLGNYLAQFGKYDVTEGFVETVVPIIRDQPLFEEVEFNGAVRRTHYSTSGGVTTWKAGLTWRAADFIRFRGTRSRDIRAPNLSELFNTGATNRAPTFLDQFYNPPRTLSAVLNITRGNPDLKPEVADTLTFGAVLTPRFIRNLDISMDAYDIQIEGAIATVGGSQSTLDCRNGSQEACARVVRDAAGNVVTTYQQPVNLSVLKAAGADFEVAYRFGLADIAEPLSGDVSLRFLGNYVKRNYTVAPGATVVDRTGDSSQPKWRWTMSGAYRLGGLNISAQARYTGSGPYDSTTLPTDLPQRNIPGQVLVDTRISYDFEVFGGQQQIYLNISNLFDRLPPDFTDQLPDAFDPVGRYFRVGLTFRH